MPANDLASLDPDTLHRLHADARMGDVARERIAERLRRLERDPLKIALQSHSGSGAPSSPSGGLVRAAGAQQRSRAGKRRGEPNALEQRFAVERMDAMLHAGLVTRYEFEPLTFHVHGVGAKYTPDFVATLPESGLWCFEVKGSRLHEASVVRLKLHANARPWIRWTMMQRQKVTGIWRVVMDLNAGERA